MDLLRECIHIDTATCHHSSQEEAALFHQKHVLRMEKPLSPEGQKRTHPDRAYLMSLGCPNDLPAPNKTNIELL